jgi:hypothetical protein
VIWQQYIVVQAALVHFCLLILSKHLGILNVGNLPFDCASLLTHRHSRALSDLAI